MKMEYQLTVFTHNGLHNGHYCPAPKRITSIHKFVRSSLEATFEFHLLVY